MAQALSHPARLAILKLMADRKRRLSGEISDALPLARTTVSQHLTALRKSGLLRGQARGLTVTYWLNQQVAQTILRQLSSFAIAIFSCPVCHKGNGCACIDIED